MYITLITKNYIFKMNLNNIALIFVEVLLMSGTPSLRIIKLFISMLKYLQSQ